MRLVSAAALLVVLGATPALAQSDPAVPAPPSSDSSPRPEPAGVVDELGAPLAEPYFPPGYRRPASGTNEVADTRTVVHVLSWGDDELTVHSRARATRWGQRSNERWTALCAAPCTLRLDPGSYELGISPAGGGPRIADDQPVLIDRGRAALQVSYDHRTGLRSLGWTFFSIGATALGASIVADVVSGWFIWSLIVGLPIMLPLSIPFFILAFLEDSARVEVIPLDG